jgi:hypothetical protein
MSPSGAAVIGPPHSRVPSPAGEVAAAGGDAADGGALLADGSAYFVGEGPEVAGEGAELVVFDDPAERAAEPGRGGGGAEDGAPLREDLPGGAVVAGVEQGQDVDAEGGG